MQTISERSARDAAFGLLRATVAEYEAAGRTTLAAPLKVALQRRSSGWFDETKLGYSRFKSFLEAARDVGIVDFEPTEGGDLRVFSQQSPSRPTAEKAASSPIQRTSYVRSDIWRAFFDWRPHFERWYDLDEERALVVASDSDVIAHLRGRSRDRLVPIEPVTMEMQLQWMRDFANAASQGHRGPLTRALESERPLAAFTQATREAALDQEWKRERQRRVIDVIHAWMAERQIELPLFGNRRRAEDGVGVRRDEAEVRRRLHAAIDRMPMSELLRLSIPLEYLLP